MATTPSSRDQTTEGARHQMTLNEVPQVSQSLKLSCARCGNGHIYDVGTIFCEAESDAPAGKVRYGFAKYFRCRDCASAGPWEVADLLTLFHLLVRAKLINGGHGFLAGGCRLFDGTPIQTPAMGEEYLRALLEQNPRSAFLHTRLGNLFRSCGERARAREWYGKAIALDAGEMEARYHLYGFAVDDGNVPAALEHVLLLVRHLSEGRKSGTEELTEGIARSVVHTLRCASLEFREELLGKPNPPVEPPEETFIRTLLEQEGDDDDIVARATKRLLTGTVSSSAPSAESVFNPDKRFTAPRQAC